MRDWKQEYENLLDQHEAFKQNIGIDITRREAEFRLELERVVKQYDKDFLAMKERYERDILECKKETKIEWDNLFKLGKEVDKRLLQLELLIVILAFYILFGILNYFGII